MQPIVGAFTTVISCLWEDRLPRWQVRHACTVVIWQDEFAFLFKRLISQHFEVIGPLITETP
jgi:hypothetical protein